MKGVRQLLFLVSVMVCVMYYKEMLCFVEKKSDVLKELKDKVRYKETIDADETYYKNELNKIWSKLEEEQKNAETEFSKVCFISESNSK